MKKHSPSRKSGPASSTSSRGGRPGSGSASRSGSAGGRSKSSQGFAARGGSPAGGPRGAGRGSEGRFGGAARASARPDFITVPKLGRMVMGTHAIREAFKVHPQSIQTLILQERWEHSEDLREIEKLGRSRKIQVEQRPVTTLDRMGSHQGALLVMNDQPEIELADLLHLDECILLALDGVEDPQNLGAILRTAWLMGVKAVIIPEDRAVGLSPVVHKVAAGGVEHVPLIRHNNFTAIFEELRENGFWSFGLSHEAKSSLYDMKVPAKIVWALGAEDKGLRTSTERVCDELVQIPQLSAEASYNVSVTAAMVLSETYRQTRHQPQGGSSR